MALCSLLLALGTWPADSAAAATRVELVIDEPYAARSVDWPVTTGVPFPRGQLTSDTQCRLIDDRGREQPLQSRVAATWDAAKSSIRWLTIDFIAEPGRTYALEFSPEIERQKFKPSLNVSPGESVRVATGAIEVDFSRDTPAALRAIRADLNGDGTIGAKELVAGGTSQPDHAYLDQRGQSFSSTHDGTSRRIVVETTGPVRACIRVDGSYRNPRGERIVDYRTRYHLFAGLGLIKVIDEFRIVGSTANTRFRDIRFALELAGDVGRAESREQKAKSQSESGEAATSGSKLSEPTTRTVTFDGSGKAGNQVVTVRWQPETKSVASYQATYRHFGNPECRGAVVETTAAGQRTLSQSEFVGEWMQVVDRRSALTGSLRGFWQQFPKEWETTGDQFILHLWSPRGGELDFGAAGLRAFFGEAGEKYILDWKGVNGTLDAISNFFYFAGRGALGRGEVDGRGINKHHEFYLHAAPANQAQKGREYGRLAAGPPLALASGKWNCSTDVFGPLAARPNDSKYEAIVDRIFDLGREAQQSFGDYGWWVYGSGPHYSYQWDEQTGRHYADPRRFEYHTYQKETQLWWNYLRSGERKFHDWAFPSEDHWVDIAVTHVPLTYRCDWRGGVRQQQTLHFRPGDWSIDSAMFYVRQRDSAEAWLRGGSQFWASYHRTLETTTLAYYLTGDERYNDVLNYWRDYWADLAGKTSASRDFQPWHKEQPWYEPTAAGEPVKTWAEMIRDYCPFTSGLRHQMTCFFNLATLYEHTWDPKIGQSLRECADAYLDLDRHLGVWRSQESGPPFAADAPLLAHFWVPALWKYARATGDPRMPEVFRRYFAAAYAADPFREDVGRYSNVHLAYAWYYTHDPRHLRPAQRELDLLLPHAQPLANPEELGRRLYNPYAPIKALTAVPRLIWALDNAEKSGVEMLPAPPLGPQRTAIAFQKREGRAVRMTLWGYDRRPKLIGPDGKPFAGAEIITEQHASDVQPFDRNLPNFEVYLHELTISADAPPGFYLFAPTLELAVLGIDDGGKAASPLLINSSLPVSIAPGEICRLTCPAAWREIQLESAAAATLQIADVHGTVLPSETAGHRLSAALKQSDSEHSIQIRNVGKQPAWFRIADRPAEACWVTLDSTGPPSLPSPSQTAAALPSGNSIDNDKSIFVPGRFGKALRITPGRTLALPDHVETGGEVVRLFDLRQGTIEFWIKRQWDVRLTSPRPITFLTNGLIEAWCPWKLPLGEWMHVAVEWRPLKRDPARQAVHIYVDGHDARNYRSTWWEGYSQKPLTFRKRKEWLKQFLCGTQPGAPYVIDELRISSVPRHARLDVELGNRQIFNPARFTPSEKTFDLDPQTLLLLHFDGNLSGTSARIGRALEGTVTDK